MLRSQPASAATPSVRGTPNITGTASCVRAQPVPASRPAAICSTRSQAELLSAGVPAGALPALDELVEPAVAGEQLVEVDQIVELKLSASGGRGRQPVRNGHQLDGHLDGNLRAAGHQQVAGTGRDRPEGVTSADRAAEGASPG